ncbi:MAG: hypothetical protein LC624_10455 [Halobacteriales archaeon]|nr:hypothetical protein [Halobacteriales archaeon]
MAVLIGPDVGARSLWMRQALLVTVLAGEPGAEPEVPGAELWGARLRAS